MQCAYCGATLRPCAKVCDACGAEVAPANPPTPSIAEDPIPEAFPYADPSAQPVEPPAAALPPEPEPVSYTPATFADIAAAAGGAAPVNPPPVLAIISLVLGVLSLCASLFPLCGAPISIIGIILGILSLKNSSTQRGLAIGGIACNSVGLLLAVIFTIAFLFISRQSGN